MIPRVVGVGGIATTRMSLALASPAIESARPTVSFAGSSSEIERIERRHIRPVRPDEPAVVAVDAAVAGQADPAVGGSRNTDEPAPIGAVVLAAPDVPIAARMSRSSANVIATPNSATVGVIVEGVDRRDPVAGGRVEVDPAQPEVERAGERLRFGALSKRAAVELHLIVEAEPRRDDQRVGVRQASSASANPGSGVQSRCSTMMSVPRVPWAMPRMRSPPCMYQVTRGTGCQPSTGGLTTRNRSLAHAVGEGFSDLRNRRAVSVIAISVGSRSMLDARRTRRPRSSARARKRRRPARRRTAVTRTITSLRTSTAGDGRLAEDAGVDEDHGPSSRSRSRENPYSAPWCPAFRSLRRSPSVTSRSPSGLVRATGLTRTRRP